MQDLIHQIETLEIHDNDVIIIKSKQSISAVMFKELQRMLNKKAKNLILINCKDGMEIKNINESEMNKHGWFRKE